MPDIPTRHDPSGRTPPGGLWGDGTDIWIEPGTADQLASEQTARETSEAARVSSSGVNAGQEFGDRMRDQAGQVLPMRQVDTEQIDRSRVLGDQSYGQQQRALSMLRAQAQGQGPSVAQLQGTAGIDNAGRQMMGSRGGSMTAAMMSGAPQNVAAQAATGRAGEIQQAQGAWGQGGQKMRGQSLEGQHQALQGQWLDTDLNLAQQKQNLDRELALQRLSQGGYQMYTGAENDIRNTYAGINSSAADAQRANNAAFLNMVGSAVGSAGGMVGSAFGSGGGGGGSKWGGRGQDEDFGDKYGNG